LSDRQKGGAAMVRRIKIALVVLATLAIAALVAGTPWGP
jgi:hypothetical protein